MKFEAALLMMIAGKAVRRPSWGGYWEYENGTIVIHNKDGSVLDIRETKQVIFTLANICANDWEVCEPVLNPDA